MAPVVIPDPLRTFLDSEGAPMTIQRLLTAALAFVFTMGSMPASNAATSSTDDAYPRETERATLLESIASLEEQKLQIENLAKASPNAQRFLEIFRTEFWPLAVRLSAMNERESLLYVANDRALYADEAEKKAWNQEMIDLSEASSKISTSESYRDLVRRLGEAAEGLTGDLAELARRMLRQQERSGFDTAQLPTLNRLGKIMNEVKQIANESPISKHLAATARESDAIEKKFRSGEISFTDAYLALEALRSKGGAAHGQYVAQTASELLNEAAILRTELARAKGFKNWAEFQVSNNAEHYANGYRTTTERITFLRDLLSTTQDTHRAFYEQRIRETPGVPEDLKADLRNFRSSQSGLFSLPTDSLVLEYFPVENVESFWRQTMLESGFSETALSRITLDSYPREGKQTHAYMMPARSHQPYVIRVDAETLNVPIPRQVPGTWMPANIQIVQNMRADGPDAYSTAFHEGGHGLDFSHRQDVLGLGQDSSYAETHSMTMENFLLDRDFLLAKARTRDGKPIPADLVDLYIANSKLNALSSLRGQSLNSLYDLELWNHAYERGGESFVDRATRLSAELSDTYMFANNGRMVDGVNTLYARFSTDHFYGGQVGYIGYVFAEMAATMSYEQLLDILEERTGRRTLLNQPEIAKLLIEGYYKRGFAKEFPVATEDFTKKKFDARETAKLINRSVDSWVQMRRVSRCEAIFVPSVKPGH